MVTMKDLLECGVHFGHQTRRWNPKTKNSFLALGKISILLICKKPCATLDTPIISCAMRALKAKASCL